jgi:hypothetical protein
LEKIVEWNLVKIGRQGKRERGEVKRERERGEGESWTKLGEERERERERERGRSWAKLGEKVIASSFRKENSFRKKGRKKFEIDIRKNGREKEKRDRKKKETIWEKYEKKEKEKEKGKVFEKIDWKLFR